MKKRKDLLWEAIDQARLNKVLFLVKLTGIPESIVSTVCENLSTTAIDYYIDHSEDFKDISIKIIETSNNLRLSNLYQLEQCVNN